MKMEETQRRDAKTGVSLKTAGEGRANSPCRRAEGIGDGIKSFINLGEPNLLNKGKCADEEDKEGEGK